MVRTMRSLTLCLSLIWAVALVGPAYAQSSDPFYQGKMLRFIVGASAGGGFDTYTRLLARHVGKHIPGNPSTIVANMPGAGHLIAANYMYAKAKPDGLTIGNWVGGLVFKQVAGQGQGIRFDARKFEWVGLPVSDSMVCLLSRKTGIRSLEDWASSGSTVKIGALRPGSLTYDFPKILKDTLKLPLRVVGGYRGSAGIRLAMEKGEVDGACVSWESIKSTWRKQLQENAIEILVQGLPKRHPELPNVPTARESVNTPLARTLLKAGVEDRSIILRPYMLPPGTPKERVGIIRDAFMATMKDPEFLAEAQRSKLDINPLPGHRIEAVVEDMFRQDGKVVAELKGILTAKDR